MKEWQAWQISSTWWHLAMAVNSLSSQILTVVKAAISRRCSKKFACIIPIDRITTTATTAIKTRILLLLAPIINHLNHRRYLKMAEKFKLKETPMRKRRGIWKNFIQASALSAHLWKDCRPYSIMRRMFCGRMQATISMLLIKQKNYRPNRKTKILI